MIRICVAILLAVVVNTQESNIRYFVSENNDHDPSDDDPVIISNSSEYSTEIKSQYGVSSFRNDKSNTASTNGIPIHHDNTRRQMERTFKFIKIRDGGENGNGTFKGYPSSRIPTRNYKKPDKINLKHFNIDTSKFEIHTFEPSQNDSDFIVNYEATKHKLEPTVMEIPQLSDTSKSLDASIRNSQMNEYGHERSNGNSYLPETLTDSYDNTRTGYIESIQSAYGIPKSLNIGYKSQKSRKQYGILKFFGDIHKEDFTSIAPENNKGSINNFGTQLNTKYELPINNKHSRINIENRDVNSKTKFYDSPADAVNKTYKMPKLDDNYPINFHAKFNKTNYSGDSANDQVFDNSNDNYEEIFQDYNDDIGDQSFSRNADERYSKEEIFDYDHYGTQISDSSVDLLRSSPGVIGVTQAIIRSNSEFNQPSQSKSSRNHQYDTQDNVARINKGNSNQNLRTVKQSRQYGKPLVQYAHLQATKRTKEYNQFDGYLSGRNNDHNEKVPAVYRFEYAVSDNGNDQFGHRESRQSAKTIGSYHVILPDGRKQIVEYEADEDGFKPRIRYEKIGYGDGPVSRYSDHQNEYGLGKDRHTGYDINKDY